MANGSWMVEKGEYVPGYKASKGNVRARLSVGKQQKNAWKTEYAWVLFTDPMFGKGYLYQSRQGAENACGWMSSLLIFSK